MGCPAAPEYVVPFVLAPQGFPAVPAAGGVAWYTYARTARPVPRFIGSTLKSPPRYTLTGAPGATEFALLRISSIALGICAIKIRAWGDSCLAPLLSAGLASLYML
jgi:hypothetical protein